MSALTDQLAALLTVEDYCTYLKVQKDLAPNSINKYKQQIGSFCAWLGEREPNAELAALFLAELREGGKNRTTIRAYYAAIKPFLRWHGIDFTLRLKRVKRLPRYHTKDEVDQLIQAITQRQDNWAKNKERDALIVKMLASTGLRRSELLSLRRQDIKHGFVFVSHGKGERDRVIPLTTTLGKELSAYIDQNHLVPYNRLFPIGPNRLDRMIREAAAKAGLSNMSPHDLRHYFATRLIELGAELRNVQELLGHEDISTTAIYLDVIPAHLKKTVELLEQNQL